MRARVHTLTYTHIHTYTHTAHTQRQTHTLCSIYMHVQVLFTVSALVKAYQGGGRGRGGADEGGGRGEVEEGIFQESG